MKVRFSSRKEQDPTRDGGLKVLYAPGKRAAFRLRWYLILILMASPFLWFVGKIVMGLLLIEAPGRVVQPMLDVRAQEAGKVADILVEPGDWINIGQPLIRLENTQLLAQKEYLVANLRVPDTSGQKQLVTRQIDNLRQRVARARQRVRNLETLVRSGAATMGELNGARDTRDEREHELTQLQLRLRESFDREVALARDQGQLKLVEKRLASLGILAPESARVGEIAVSEGESVGPGTLMLRLERQKTPRINVFLPVSRMELASAGQSLRLQFPDGRWYNARVTGHPTDVRRLPPDLRSPFGAAERGLLVEVSMDRPIPPRWRINNVSLTARFPNFFQRFASANLHQKAWTH